MQDIVNTLKNNEASNGKKKSRTAKWFDVLMKSECAWILEIPSQDLKWNEILKHVIR